MPIKLKSVGGGEITIDAPNTASNYTVTLPASNATVLNSDSTLDATKLSGLVPVGSLTNAPTYNYSGTVAPTASTNPTITNAVWLNTSNGSRYVCVDNTTNKNVWRRIEYSDIISASTVFDIFGDSSAVALYQFENGSGTDTGGLYSMTTNNFSSGTGILGTCATANPGYMKGGLINNNLVISVSCWINTSNTGNHWAWTSSYTSNGQNKRGLRISNLVAQPIGSEYTTTPSTTIASGVWTHLVVANNKFYKNAELVGTIGTVASAASSTYGFYIGANGAYDYGYVMDENYGYPLNGSIDQLRVFNREITQAEVATLYAEGGGGL